MGLFVVLGWVELEMWEAWAGDILPASHFARLVDRAAEFFGRQGGRWMAMGEGQPIGVNDTKLRRKPPA